MEESRLRLQLFVRDLLKLDQQVQSFFHGRLQNKSAPEGALSITFIFLSPYIRNSAFRTPH
jgi:hypothetical protein